MPRHVGLAILLAAATVPPAGAEVAGYTAAEVRGRTVLTSVTVRRGRGPVTFNPEKLIGVLVVHFRSTTPQNVVTAAALQRPPSRIEPVPGTPDVLDFPRDVQPILDRHCARCHRPERYEGRVDLTGDHTPLFSQSYWTLTERGLISDGRNEKYGERPPGGIGSSASRLLDLVDGSHYDAKLSDHERAVLRLWIDASATYPGTYAALGSGMVPVEFPVEVIQRRCGECHGHEPKGRARIGTGPPLPLVHDFFELQMIRARIGCFKFGSSRPPQSLCNLTRPEMSLLLRAPLAVDAGGLEFCEPAVFRNRDDPDYQAILARITAAANRHAREKRFDMPVFRPNDYCVRHMQAYGVLPENLVK